MELSEQKPFTSIRLTSEGILFWGSIIGLFLLCHLTQDAVARLTTRLDGGLWYYLPSLKGILFLLCVGVLTHPIVIDARRVFATTQKGAIRHTLAVSVAVATLLALLVFHLGNDAMGTRYALRSLAPFEQHTDWYNKRLLMPAVAYILFFRGGWLYYIFSSLIFLLFLSVVYSWLKSHTCLKPWHFLSLSTCSFVIFQYQFPGYPDILAFTLFVLVMSQGFGQKSKLHLLILAILTHEFSLFLGHFLAYHYLNRSHLLNYLFAVILYGMIWALSYGFSFQDMFESHHVLGRSAVEWVFLRPDREILGVFIAFKAVWLLLIIGPILALQFHLYRDVTFIVGCILTGILITFLGVDTSRQMGIAFPGVLVALETICRHMPQHFTNRTLSVIFAANMVIPSFYVGLNTWIILRPGLYEQLFFIFASITQAI